VVVGAGYRGCVKGNDPMAISYASALKTHLAHAPVNPTKEEEQSIAERLRRHERVEPELVAAASHLGKHAILHPTKAIPGEQLPDDLF
jgi:hypothetical protein